MPQGLEVQVLSRAPFPDSMFDILWSPLTNHFTRCQCAAKVLIRRNGVCAEARQGWHILVETGIKNSKAPQKMFWGARPSRLHRFASRGTERCIRRGRRTRQARRLRSPINRRNLDLVWVCEDSASPALISVPKAAAPLRGRIVSLRVPRRYFCAAIRNVSKTAKDVS